jgi:AcrR family transcriptional regulator
MARSPSITDAQILEAARAVFLEHGFSGTTSDVAKRAGCAEGSLFNRFPTKAELFAAAMRSDPDLPEWINTLSNSPGEGDLKAKLVRAGTEAIEFFRRIMPMMMMAWSNPSVACGDGPNAPPVRALKRLTAFFEGEMRAGRMRRHDPEIFARTFAGSIVHYVFNELVLKTQDELPLAPDSFIRGLVNILWTGTEPDSAVPRKAR